MFGLGMTLLVSDFKELAQRPRATVLGVVLQIVALPLVAFALANLMLRDNPVLAMGLMVLAACPGGATSNLITFLARGDMAVSVTLTAISSFIAVLTIPLLISFSLNWFMGEGQTIAPPIVEMIGQVVVVTILPVSLGMLVRSRAPDFAAKAERPVKLISSILLAVIVLGLVASQRDEIGTFFREAGVATLLLNLSMLALGYLAGRLMNFTLAERISLSIEGGIQNGTLGIAIAIGILGNNQMAIPSAIYSLIMFVTGFLAIFVFSRMVARQEEAQASSSPA